jgi:hypothetical protein
MLHNADRMWNRFQMLCCGQLRPRQQDDEGSSKQVQQLGSSGHIVSLNHKL